MTRSKADFMPLARQKGSVIQALVDEVLVCDLERHRAHSLNPVAAATWDLCDGHTSVAQMVSQLCANGSTMVTDGVGYGLRQLGKFRLLENRLPEGAGLSRRQVLRRVGMAAAVGLPVVASILAPTAVEAGSCVGSGQSCVSLPCCIGPCIGGTGCIT